MMLGIVTTDVTFTPHLSSHQHSEAFFRSQLFFDNCVCTTYSSHSSFGILFCFFGYVASFSMPLPFLTPVGQWGHLLSCFCLFQAVPCCFMRPMGRIPWTRAVPHDVPSLLRTALCSLSQNIPRRKTCSASATPLEMSTFSRYCCAVRGGSKERHGVNEKEWK